METPDENFAVGLNWKQSKVSFGEEGNISLVNAS